MLWEPGDSEGGRGTYPKRKVMKYLGKSGFWGSLRKDNLPRQKLPRPLKHSSSFILGGRFLLGGPSASCPGVPCFTLAATP